MRITVELSGCWFNSPWCGSLSRSAGFSRGFAVHALRLRNELPLQGQFPEPKGFYSRVGERVVTMLQTVFIKTDFIFYDETIRTY